MISGRRFRHLCAPRHEEFAVMISEPLTGIVGLRTVGIPVTDQGRALDFYGGTLGFETRLDVTVGPLRWIEVAPPGALTTVALVQAEEGRPAKVDTGIRFATRDAAACREQLLARGVAVDELLRWPG